MTNRLAQNGNCAANHQLLTSKPSHPTRDAWIETAASALAWEVAAVASHTGCVD